MLAETACDAEIEQGDSAVGADEQVPAVEVAVEDAVEHGPFQERDHLGAQHCRRVDPDGTHALDVVPREALEPFHDQHAACDQPWMRARHDDGTLVGLR